jgi:SAM-dependent methyltransferase
MSGSSTFAMKYADYTFRDKNPVKRWLQRQRLVSAIEVLGQPSRPPEVICDFGGGNGELCKLPIAMVICYEPVTDLLAEAQENLRTVPGVDVVQDLRRIAPGSVDVVFCLEVFEHLPTEETVDAFRDLSALLKPEGTLVIGVPVEVGVPALYKGLFRLMRGYGSFYAGVTNILRSGLGNPPADRPIAEIAPGRRYCYEHMGFDYRRFRERLDGSFRLQRIASSPFAWPGAWLMPEIYFVAVKSRDLLHHT